MNQITITFIGQFLLAFICFVMLLKIEKVFLVLIVSSALTTVTVFYIGENNILLFQLIFVIVVVKFLLIYGIHFETNRLLFLFICYTGLSIPLSFFSSDSMVININGKFTMVQFSFQQISQYLYLLIGFLTYAITYFLFKYNKISFQKVEKVMIYTYMFILLIGNLQPYIPKDIINLYFRNTYTIGYAEQGARISSTFGEPSFLSLYITPLFSMSVYKIIEKFEWKYLICILLTLNIITNNNSSSFYIGIVFFVLCYFLFLCRKKIKINKNKLVIILLIGIPVLIILLILFRETFINGIKVFINKIQVENSIKGTSGYIRRETLRLHLKVFFDNILFGVGYGTVRSNDLVSTFLAELGIIGNTLFYSYIISLILRLYRKNSRQYNQFIILIVVSLGILLVSVPEIYLLFIWTYFGMAEGFLEADERNKKL